MLFNSFEFAVFFPIVTILFFLIPHRFRWFLLLAASCFFYMFFKPIYILILVFTIIIDYFAGIMISNAKDKRQKKYLLVLSIFANVGVLAVFKYYNFIAGNLNTLFNSINGGGNIPLLSILLPIGLSFHTFQAMSYTIEVYRGNQQPEKHFGIYALYVMFYPQLVAGPIERPQNILHQFHEEKYFNYENARRGLIQMAWGLFKKVVVADRLALFVNHVYGSPFKYSGIPLIISTLFFAFQIYCDFSGYSDIAIGAARVMGFKLMTNFNKPYQAKSVTEFWKRWHISLSTWFRDYLYISIGGNRVTIPRWYLNLLIVFLVSGLWHGANWTFLLWGFLHGMAVIFETVSKKFSAGIALHIPKFIYHKGCQLLTFCFVSFAWIFFRATNTSEAFYITRNIFINLPFQIREIVANRHLSRLNLLYLGQSLNDLILAIAGIACIIFIQSKERKSTIDEWVIAKPAYVRWGFYYLILIAFVSFGIFNKSEFIYFQF